MSTYRFAAAAALVAFAAAPARSDDADGSPAYTAPAPAAQSGAGQKSELVRERYSGRMVKLERHVTQDANLNFVNHGAWTMWNPAGNVVARGEYVLGKRHGDWKRWHFDEAASRSDEAAETASAEELRGAEYDGFERPFLSEARFSDGQIVGPWTLADSEGKKVFSIELDHNVATGKAIWWHSTGQKRREIDFRKGIVDGEWREWDADGRETRNDHYIEGCRIAEVVTRFDNGEKSSEGAYLYPRDAVKIESDWWAGRLAVSASPGDGKTLKQGKWVFWHDNGEKRCEAEYLDDLPVGWHVWWHSNGQKECEGGYTEGRPQGTWTFWHANGLRASQGDYELGMKAGRWIRWNADGKVAENKDHGQPAPGAVKTYPVSHAPDSSGRPTPPPHSGAPPITPTSGAAPTSLPANRTAVNCPNCRPRR